jgi:hypothetical protein
MPRTPPSTHRPFRNQEFELKSKALNQECCRSTSARSGRRRRGFPLNLPCRDRRQKQSRAGGRAGSKPAIPCGRTASSALDKVRPRIERALTQAKKHAVAARTTSSNLQRGAMSPSCSVAPKWTSVPILCASGAILKCRSEPNRCHAHRAGPPATAVIGPVSPFRGFAFGDRPIDMQVIGDRFWAEDLCARLFDPVDRPPTCRRHECR